MEPDIQLQSGNEPSRGHAAPESKADCTPLPALDTQPGRMLARNGWHHSWRSYCVSNSCCPRWATLGKSPNFSKPVSLFMVHSIYQRKLWGR
jgi:hypothetical protein